MRVFVARHGWKSTPIAPQEWADAVRDSPDLELHQLPNGEMTALLRGSRRRRVTWHDGYLAAHHTNARMAAALFDLATRLDAGVYNQGRQRFVDLTDWEQQGGQHDSSQCLSSEVDQGSATLAGSSAAWAAWLMLAVGLAFYLMGD